MAGYEVKIHLIMYQAYFPGLGRGLRGLKQALDRLRTVARDKQRNSGANKRLQQTVNRRVFDERMRDPYS